MQRLKLYNQSNRIRLKNRAVPDLPSVDNVPVLIPQKALDAIKADGSYEFVEAVKMGEGTSGFYTPEYFQSVLDYLKQCPMGGSKDGHDTSKDDCYTIGGEIKDDYCYFRVLVPPTDWNGNSNEGLVRSLKAGTLEMSIIANVEPERGEDGQTYFRKELGRPRNDIVPEGAMDVTIGNSAKEKEVMALIEKGAIDMISESKELVKNGKVFRKAAVALQSTSDKAFAGRVLNAIAEKNKSKIRRKAMSILNKFHNAEGEPIGLTYQDVIEWLKNAITNQTITAEDLMRDIGFQNKLRKNEDELREDLEDSIIECLGLPEEASTKEILEAVKDILEENEEAANSIVEAKANELAGEKKIKNSDGTETDNPVYVHAKRELKGKRGKELNSAAEKLKDDPVIQALRSKQADTRVVAKNSSEEDKPKMREV